MNEIKQISSLQNAWVKKILLLKEKSRERKKANHFVLEGQREVQMALKGGYILKQLFFYEALLEEAEVAQIITDLNPKPELIAISKEVYQKIAYRETTEGILAIAASKSHDLNELVFKNDTPLILVTEAPEKPGNIGALLRTTDAANLDAVIIANPKGDLYNPNVIRSSVGCIFTNQIAIASTTEVIDFLKKNNIDVYSMALSASVPYTTIDFNKAAAIVVGTESTGLTNDWITNATQNCIIPMRGEIDSMNVSVSAAIVIFEALRQRGF